MAYFSNGSEGAHYEAKFCERCVHQPEGETGDGCPVWLLHLLWNYDQCNQDEAGEAKCHGLNVLWPRHERGENGDCKMFVERKTN